MKPRYVIRYLLQNRPTRGFYRDAHGKPFEFESKEDAAWMLRSWDVNLRDWVLITVTRKA